MTDTIKPVRVSQKSKQDIWERLIADWKTSGLTQKQYCRVRRVTINDGQQGKINEGARLFRRED